MAPSVKKKKGSCALSPWGRVTGGGWGKGCHLEGGHGADGARSPGPRSSTASRDTLALILNLLFYTSFSSSFTFLEKKIKVGGDKNKALHNLYVGQCFMGILDLNAARWNSVAISRVTGAEATSPGALTTGP